MSMAAPPETALATGFTPRDAGGELSDLPRERSLRHTTSKKFRSNARSNEDVRTYVRYNRTQHLSGLPRVASTAAALGHHL